MAIVYKERRNSTIASVSSLRRQLNEAQDYTLAELERFGWELKFIRRPLFQDPMPVVSDADRNEHAVLLPNGELDRSGLKIRG